MQVPGSEEQNFASPLAGSSIGCGATEIAALPEWGIDAIHTSMQPSMVGSFLTVDNIKVYERLGEIRVSFDSPIQSPKSRVTKTNRHSARLLDVSDTMIPAQKPVRAFCILTRLVIGNCMFTADVWLTGKRFGSNRFVVGSNVLGSRYEVDPAKPYQLGQPVHRFMNLMQREL